MINIYKISKENSNYKDRMETKTVSKLMLLALLGTDIFFLWWFLICEVSENRKGCLEWIAQEILIGTCVCARVRAHTRAPFHLLSVVLTYHGESSYLFIEWTQQPSLSSWGGCLESSNQLHP